jgi:hypothetical protein
MPLDAGRLRLFRSIKSSIELHPSSPSLPWQLSTIINVCNYSPLSSDFFSFLISLRIFCPATYA